ncbi:unnamed protein product [Mycena citricolor]|uniref:Uncharacterized protein n=1 Tax=Mycena citricolor TaxID=2018698 RepID=A0AAD2K1X0_9AGAR|nr:unnamed protein product [Mycena citricolor]
MLTLRARRQSASASGRRGRRSSRAGQGHVLEYNRALDSYRQDLFYFKVGTQLILPSRTSGTGLTEKCRGDDRGRSTCCPCLLRR